MRATLGCDFHHGARIRKNTLLKSVQTMGKFLLKAVLILLIVWIMTAQAQEKAKNDDFYAGNSAEKLKHSAHGDQLTCVDCHVPIEGTTKRRKVACAQCHVGEDASYARNYPGKGGMAAVVKCQDCHGGAHEMLAPGDSRSPLNRANIPVTCGKCHTSIEESLLAGKHGPGIAPGKGAVPVCIDCHVIHDHKPATIPSTLRGK
jgi:hypothetical protein